MVISAILHETRGKPNPELENLCSEHDRRAGAATRQIAQVDCCTVQIDDGFDHGKAEPRSLASWLRGKKGLEDFRKAILGDAMASRALTQRLSST